MSERYLQNGQSYHIIASQTKENGKYYWRCYVNGNRVVNEENKKPKEFSAVKIYSSMPEYTDVKTVGTIHDLIITDFNPLPGILLQHNDVVYYVCTNRCF